MRQALKLMKGKASGKIVKMLADSKDGCTDLALKTEISSGTAGSEFNLGPAFAHLSKSCKRFGVDKAAVLWKKSMRGRKGKMSYFYRLTDVATRLVREIPNFDEEEEPDWEGLKGFE